MAFKLLSGVATPALKAATVQLWTIFQDSGRKRLPDLRAVGECADWLSGQLNRQAFEVDDAGWETVQSYLDSAEFATLLEHIMVDLLSSNGAHLTVLRRELGAGLAVYSFEDDAVADRLFAVLTEMVDRIFRAVGYQGRSTLTTRASEEAARKRQEMYLQAIEAHLARMVSSDRPDIRNLNAKVRKFRMVASAVVGKIQPPSMDGAAIVDIDRLYVPSKLTKGVNHSPTTIDEDARISIAELAACHRAVVLGDPGGGKSTLCRKLANDLLASVVAGSSRASDSVIPFIVVLRDFGRQRRQAPCSIAEYIAIEMRASFQLDFSVGEIEWLLGVGRMYVLLDGLDELLNTEDRRSIAMAIDSLSQLYPESRMLVTSRRVGYMTASLGDPAFEVFQLGVLDEDGIRAYVRNWFALQIRSRKSDQDALTEQFVAESSIAPDVRCNPLMLALMCTIYKNESYIPRNRPELYEKCSRMLFDRWDRHRGLLEPFEFEAHVEPALMFIANAIYSNAEFQSGVTESSLVELASTYLHAWQYDDIEKARSSARVFVEFCRGRAWVFTDVGLDDRDESIYQFTHRTFLEFFTASHLARSTPDVEALTQDLIPQITLTEWDVVAQLALQIKSKSIQGGSDQVVRLLLEAADLAIGDDALALLNFTCRALSFLVVTPDSSRMVVDAVLERVMMDAQVYDEQWTSTADTTWGQYSSTSGALIEPMRFAAREVKPAIIAAFVGGLGRRLDEAEKNPEDLCQEIALLTRVTSGLADQLGVNSEEATPEFELLQERSISILMEKIREWHWATVLLVHKSRVSWQAAVEAQGAVLLYGCPHIPAANARYLGLVEYGVWRLIVGSYDDEGNFSSSGLREMLEVFSAFILSHAPVAVRRGLLVPPSGSARDAGRDRRALDALSDENLYQLAILLAFLEELKESDGARRRQPEKWSSTLLSVLEPYRTSRLLDSGDNTLTLGATPESTAFSDWVNYRFDLVRRVWDE